MTDDELAGLRKLCDVATPPPWGIDPDSPDRLRGAVNGVERCLATVLRTAYGLRPNAEAEANAAFCAAARSALPALLDENARLRARVGELEAVAEFFQNRAVIADALVAKLVPKLAALEDALRPFAGCLEYCLVELRGDLTLLVNQYDPDSATFDDCRRAAALLAPDSPPGEPPPPPGRP